MSLPAAIAAIPIFAWVFLLLPVTAAALGAAHAAHRLRAAPDLPRLRRRAAALAVWDVTTALLLLLHAGFAMSMAVTLWRPVPSWLAASLLLPVVLVTTGAAVVPRRLRALRVATAADSPQHLAQASAALGSAVADPWLVAVHRMAPMDALLLMMLLVNKPSTGSVLLFGGLVTAAGASAWWLARRRLRASGPLAEPRSLRLGAALGLALLVAGWGAWSQATSRLPESFAMGAHAGHGMAAVLDVSMLRGPQTAARVREFTLAARPATIRLASGRTVDAWAYNGVAPGPELRVRQGDLVKVTLVNRLPRPTTIHWHGIDVPNAEDGVAGVTQDAVPPGGSYTYRFITEHTGTYWYHSHQAPNEQVARGLFGKLVVLPEQGEVADLDLTVAAHTWTTAAGVDGGVLALDTADTLTRRKVVAGTRVRLRLINTDNLPASFQLHGVPFIVAALDGRDLNRPTPLHGSAVEVPGGGRADLAFMMPDAPVALVTRVSRRGGKVGLLLGPTGHDAPPASQPAPKFDSTRYGAPVASQVAGALTPATAFDRAYRSDIDERLGFFDGALRWSFAVNGRLFPHGDMYMVDKGDRVKITLRNRSSNVHPMHLHGHHFTVLTRNGRPMTGSPIVLDTLDIAPGETWQIGFVADNPGLWMDHCHNQAHAANGMDLMVAYEGMMTPFQAGRATGNRPE